MIVILILLEASPANHKSLYHNKMNYVPVQESWISEI